MSKEEKEAIKFLKKLKELQIVLTCSFWSKGEFKFNTLQKKQFDIILNLINKLQKGLESQKQGNKDLVKEGVKLSAKIVELEKELDKKDNVIDLIITDYLNLSKERMSKEEFKKWYFDLVGIKKVEEENV